MTTDEALQFLGHLCAAAVGSALRDLGVEAQVDAPTLVQPGSSPFAGAPAPGLAASVDIDDGLAGEAVVLLSEGAAGVLAAAGAGRADGAGEDATAPVEDGASAEGDAAAEGGAPLDDGAAAELDLVAATREVAVHVTSAVAATAGGILGQDVSIGEPSVSRFASEAEAADSSEHAPHAFAVSFAVDGEPGLFVQYVQNAFLVKATPGLSELALQGEASAGAGRAVGDAALRDVEVRLWAELGRARLPLAQAISMPSGAVVRLDRAVDDPIELFVNGQLYAYGRLMVIDDEWAVRIEQLARGPRREAPALIEAAEDRVEATEDRVDAAEAQAVPAAADNG
ncbi:MAG: FliM/FliN family flagellar motor switch protein [Thermoleophilia bacterium]|nr:FliM/FliN family flagellar motor switch protein [Thermoleophilia bacterium]